MSSRESGGESTEQSSDGVAHLQKAALEMIAAARAFLEVAEKVVENPETVRNAVVTVSAVAKAMMQTVDTSTRSNGDNGESVEHIPLS